MTVAPGRGAGGITLFILIVAPLAVAGAVAAILAAFVGPSVEVYAQGSPAALALVVGACVTLLVAVVAWAARRARSRAEAESFELALDTLRADRSRFLLRLDQELKNPITAIRAGLDNVTALARQPVDPALSEAVASVDAQAVRLSRLSADLRKIAEIETQTLSVTSVEIGYMLEDVKSAVEQSTGRKIALIVPRAPSALSPAAGDEGLLFLAVHNLVANAVKFSGPGTAVEMRAFDDPPWVVIEIADAGPGIPAEELTLIWEVLGRGRRARGLPGSGLGLAMVRTIVARHGGQVDVWSEGGRGTMFTIRLHPAASRWTQKLGVTGSL